MKTKQGFSKMFTAVDVEPYFCYMLQLFTRTQRKNEIPQHVY